MEEFLVSCLGSSLLSPPDTPYTQSDIPWVDNRHSLHSIHSLHTVRHFLSGWQTLPTLPALPTHSEISPEGGQTLPTHSQTFPEGGQTLHTLPTHSQKFPRWRTDTPYPPYTPYTPYTQWEIPWGGPGPPCIPESRHKPVTLGLVILQPSCSLRYDKYSLLASVPSDA